MLVFILPSSQVNEIDNGFLLSVLSGGVFKLLNEGDPDNGVGATAGSVHLG